MKQTTAIHNLIILDESGSMQSIYNQALTGANETISTISNAQKNDPSVTQYLTIVTFNSSSPDKELVPHKPIDNVSILTNNDYCPSGCTPLYDAMGISLTKLEKLVAEGDKVIVTVITDGMENASREYNSKSIKDLVDRLQAKGWIFTYIGANQDSIEVAGDLGINNAMDFRQDEVGARMMWDKLNSSREECYRKIRMRVDVNLQEDFFNKKREADRVTPTYVDSFRLRPNEFLVLGSNRFQISGNTILIDTSSPDLEQIRAQVVKLLEYARLHEDTKFYVTPIGCGRAGFTPEQIAPMFARAYSMPNITLPQSFWKVLDYEFGR